jgi:hypothetical protein
MPGVPVQTRLNLDELSALDSYRRTKPNPPTRGKALRELLHQALKESAALRHSIAANEREGGHPLEVSAMSRSDASTGAA